ncbi:MetQ/NlpA family ABC transporter substrate-binding protein [Xanthobacter sp. V4C-4]|uniref:MetQ/NlpA family ABC transporter substrate-binding protein n=1 Tax=Xanthobacter cornucopiae TaxID=3119924 RepID=UPI0037287659
MIAHLVPAIDRVGRNRRPGQRGGTRRHRRVALRVAAALLSLAALAGLPACSDADGAGERPIKIYVGGDDYRDVLDYVRSSGLVGNVTFKLLDAGADANALVAAGRGDLAFHQPLPAFLAEQQEASGEALQVVSRVTVAPYAIYSSKWKDLNETASRINSSLVPDTVVGDSLPHGSKVVLPDTPAGFARGLYLLQAAGLLKLDRAFGGTGIEDLSVNRDNVLETPRHVAIDGLDLGLAADIYRSFDAVVLDPRTAARIGLVPSRDALAIEAGLDNPYARVLVAPARLAGDARVLELARALESPQVAAFLANKYRGTLISARTPHQQR